MKIEHEKMFLKEIDFLSSPISLFYRGYLSHSSFLSGILSILTIIIIIFLSIFQIKNLFNRDKEIPLSTSFTYFTDDAGTIQINNSSLFHFISFDDYNDRGNEEFKFSYFNVIGIEDIFANYENNPNINNYNHWLYGLCNNDSDIKGIENIATHKFLTKSACIRKYFDINTQQYYDTNHPNFRWPSLSHGTFHPENSLYSIIIKSCDQNILDIIFNGEITCKDIKEIDTSSKGIHLNFVDHYIDVLNYNNPINKYFYKIESKFDKDNLIVNHLNFKASVIKTHKGYIFEEDEKVCSYSYDRNDVFTYIRTSDIYAGYTLYLNNRLNFYERTYKKIQDCLSSVGGILNIILYIMTCINNFINSYVILKDFNYLLNLFSITPEDINCINRKNILYKKIKQMEAIKRNSCVFTKSSPNEKEIKEEETIEKNSKEEKEKKTNESLNTEKSEITQEPKATDTNRVITINTDTKDEKVETDKEKEQNFEVFNFLQYFIYKITCGKKHSNLELYDNFRKTIISVENLMQNYLKINNLLNIEKRMSKLTSTNK